MFGVVYLLVVIFWVLSVAIEVLDTGLKAPAIVVNKLTERFEWFNFFLKIVLSFSFSSWELLIGEMDWHDDEVDDDDDE